MLIATSRLLKHPRRLILRIVLLIGDIRVCVMPYALQSPTPMQPYY